MAMGASVAGGVRGWCRVYEIQKTIAAITTNYELREKINIRGVSVGLAYTFYKTSYRYQVLNFSL